MAPNNTVEIVRHTYDCYEVTAYDLFGKAIRRRMYSYGAKRKEWAIEQAQQWADRFYLWFDPTVIYS